jgi:hypothetical protein
MSLRFQDIATAGSDPSSAVEVIIRLAAPFVRDALYRLSYPRDFTEDREPVQVVATTHSPYLLDLYRDHPEEIVIAHKKGRDARFERLSDRKDLEEILGDVHLSEAWYSGILGGVPSLE